MKHLIISLKLIVLTIAVCCIAYPALIYAAAQICMPYTANGWLLTDKTGKVAGSEIIAQAFTQDKYFQPRPSAADYNASSAGGSNLSPDNPAIAERAKALIARFKADEKNRLPADLATASGSGLDPHITLAAALFQGRRVADARKMDIEKIEEILKKNAIRANPLGGKTMLINVLMVNRELDSLNEKQYGR
jgi:K+-transporting ATPase ATPase C chain